MDDRDPIADPEQLLAHAAWVRRLAARLVFDGGRVDDVVQETWLAALSADRGRRGAVRDTRAWLGGILRNVVRRQLRGESRRRTRETAAAHRGPPVHEDRDLVAEAERQRDLVDAVLALDEPYRATVLALDLAGQSAAELARREGCSAATVRSRHARALALLRGRLDQRHGDRRAWSLAWLPLLDSAAASAAGAPTLAGPLHWLANPTLPGVPLMSAKLALSVAAVSVAVVLAVWQGFDAWVASPARPIGDEPAPVTVSVAADETASPESEAAGLAAAAAAPVALQAAAGATAPVGRPISFSGRVVDEHGDPIAGATIRLLPDGWTLAALGFDDLAGEQLACMETLPLDLRAEPWSRFQPTSSDSAGRFTLQAPLLLWEQQQWFNLWYRYPEVVLEAPGRARVSLTCTEHDDDRVLVGDVVLPEGAQLAGRVLDEQGAPVVGAVVSVTTLVHNTPAGSATARSWTVEAACQRTLTDASGRYALTGLRPGGWQLTVWAAGYESASREEQLDASGPHDLGDLVLTEGRVLHGRIQHGDGSPVVGATVHALPFRDAAPEGDRAWHEALGKLRQNRTPGRGARQLDEPPPVRGLTDADGRFRLAGLGEGGLLVAAEAAGLRPGGQVGVRPDREPLVLTLQPAGQLVLSLRHADGSPVVEPAPRARRALPVDISSPDDLALNATDAPGRWIVEGIDATPVVVRVAPEGHPTLHWLFDGLPVGTAQASHTLTLPEISSGLRGRVLDGRGQPVPGVGLNVLPVDPSVATTLADGDWQSTISDADGAYHLPHLAPGLWSLWIERPGTLGPLGHGLGGVTLPPGQPLEHDLVLPDVGTLEGRLVDGEGNQGQRRIQLLRARPGDDGSPWRFLLGADRAGRFRLGNLEPGAYTLEAEDFGYAEVLIVAGETTQVTLRPEQAPLLEGRVTAAGVPVAGIRVVLTWDDSQHASGLSTLSGPDGSYRLALTRDAPGSVRVRTDQNSESTPVALPAIRGPRTLLDLELPTHQLELRVVDGASGAPVPQARVSVFQGLVGRRVTQDRSDSQGLVRFPHLEAVEVTLSVRADGYQPVRRPASTDGAPLTVELESGARLEWQLRDGAGHPLPDGGLYVFAFVRDGESWKPSVRHSTMSRDGAVQLASLPPGPLWLLLLMPGDELSDLPLDDPQALRAHADAELELHVHAGDVLTRTSQLDGR